MIEETDFLRLSFKGNQMKIEAVLGMDGKLAIRNNNKYYRIDSGDNFYGVQEPGILCYKRDNKIRNMVEIAKFTGYAHDFNGDFWAVLETVYTYPADASKIEKEFPDFYEKHCVSDIRLSKNRICLKKRRNCLTSEANGASATGLSISQSK